MKILHSLQKILKSSAVKCGETLGKNWLFISITGKQKAKNISWFGVGEIILAVSGPSQWLIIHDQYICSTDSWLDAESGLRLSLRGLPGLPQLNLLDNILVCFQLVCNSLYWSKFEKNLTSFFRPMFFCSISVLILMSKSVMTSNTLAMLNSSIGYNSAMFSSNAFIRIVLVMFFKVASASIPKQIIREAKKNAIRF